MSYPFEIDKVYTFNTLAPGVLQSTVKNAKLSAILQYKQAVKFDNIDLKFRQVYPKLPEGTPDTPQLCIYYLFETEAGDDLVLCQYWIDEGTIDTVEGINFQVLVTGASLADIARVRDVMNALRNLTYEIKQT